MKRVAWLTDIHLNFLQPERVRLFLQDVAHELFDALLIGGDIGEAPNLLAYLRQMADMIACPIYFVLGNHDFYYGSIQAVRRDVAWLCQEFPHLHYLTQEYVCELAPTVGLVGHDGWADARLGDYERSLVMMNDYRLIEELAGTSHGRGLYYQLYDKAARLPVLRRMGDEAAEHVRSVLPPALEKYSHVLFLTHVPPFREACWHEGRLSDPEWMPHFTCKAVGDALAEIAGRHPHRQVTALCGHTHSAGEAQLLPNLRVLTGAARYGQPSVQRVFEL